MDRPHVRIPKQISFPDQATIDEVDKRARAAGLDRSNYMIRCALESEKLELRRLRAFSARVEKQLAALRRDDLVT